MWRQLQVWRRAPLTSAPARLGLAPQPLRTPGRARSAAARAWRSNSRRSRRRRNTPLSGADPTREPGPLRRYRAAARHRPLVLLVGVELDGVERQCGVDLAQ